MRRHLLLLFVVVASATALLEKAAHARAASATHVMLDQIDGFRRETWHWQALMGVARTPTRYAERHAGPSYRAWVLKLWRRRAVTTRRQAASPPHASAWRCIQRYEAPWHAATGNGYYGGLQMDLGFQRRYGADLLRREGLAHLWTPVEQMWVAERAFRSGRGFYPWPNTARWCGLI
jgi:hypothetical protein